MTSSGCTIHDSKHSTTTDGPIDSSPPSKRQCTDQSTNAVIYEWCLDRIDPDHPLFQISYFGQIVRAGLTTQQAFNKRTKEHKNKAARDPKDVGLHWAIQAFGADAFTVRVLETKCMPPVEARAWANAREIALMADDGVMRDCEPDTPIRQTFNLQHGGQGNPKAVGTPSSTVGVKWRKAQFYAEVL